jgi:glutamine synthetase
MAKPVAGQSGSGMHVHVSLLDEAGAPVLADADGAPNAVLRYAVGGLVTTMAEAMLLFAPHANSYRRFARAVTARLSAGWGMDDRSATVRVIHGSRHATRIEHRVAGADANPYLVLAGILSGMLAGIDGGIEPGPPHAPQDFGKGGRPLPLEWSTAMDAFATSDFAIDALGAEAHAVVLACKRRDHDELQARIPDVEYAAYLGSL